VAYLEVVDVTLAESENGQPRVNVGDTQSGVGTGASVPLWGSGDGFIGMPNAPTGKASAQAIVLVEGNYQRVIAIRDNRTITRAGTLAEGDRAIVSNSDALLFLDASEDTIELRSTGGAGTLRVLVDGVNSRIRLMVGSVALTVDVTGVDITGGLLKVNGVPLNVP
jgi:hypothetical protein